MAAEYMVSGTPEFLDAPPVRGVRPQRPPGIGLEPLPTVVVDHPRLGRVRVNACDHDVAIHGPVMDSRV
jgi:hypothetical protein